MDAAGDSKGFEQFVLEVEPQLRRALAGHLADGTVADAVAAALAYAWENRDRVLAMERPAGYLYRVAQSSARRRKQGWLPWSGENDLPDVEPGLPDALAALPAGQARAVWLVTACGWTHTEAADALGVSASTISTQVNRALHKLRTSLGVMTDG
ncbi:MAG: sigma-70 family RNA polymerase sigma factor [Acidimicrobiales bacterium]|nr:sigma-70 family RNA polymerase sigma factor [Acidimicrobiales bacterium]